MAVGVETSSLVSFEAKIYLLRLLPCFLRCGTACPIDTSCLSCSLWSFGFPWEAAERLPTDGERRGQWSKGRVPEEDKRDPPRAAPGSRNLPWDRFSIPTKAAYPPGAGDWGGERVFAKAAGGDSRPGGRTNAIAKTPNAGRSCAAGRRPSVSRSTARMLKGADSMPRRNGSDANGRLTRARRRRGRRWRPLPPPLRVVTQHKSILRFFVTAPVVMKRCGNLHVRRLRTVAMPAARR
jgi:hypothetical protein